MLLNVNRTIFEEERAMALQDKTHFNLSLIIPRQEQIGTQISGMERNRQDQLHRCGDETPKEHQMALQDKSQFKFSFKTPR